MKQISFKGAMLMFIGLELLTPWACVSDWNGDTNGVSPHTSHDFRPGESPAPGALADPGAKSGSREGPQQLHHPHQHPTASSAPYVEEKQRFSRPGGKTVQVFAPQAARALTMYRSLTVCTSQCAKCRRGKKSSSTGQLGVN